MIKINSSVKVLIFILSALMVQNVVFGRTQRLEAHNVMINREGGKLILYVKEGSVLPPDVGRYFAIKEDLRKYNTLTNQYIDWFVKRCSKIPARNIDGYKNDGIYSDCDDAESYSGVHFRVAINRLNRLSIYSKMILSEIEEFKGVYLYEYEVPVAVFCFKNGGKLFLVVQTISCGGSGCSGSVYIY
jgi:hypothetical protein